MSQGGFLPSHNFIPGQSPEDERPNKSWDLPARGCYRPPCCGATKVTYAYSPWQANVARNTKAYAEIDGLLLCEYWFAAGVGPIDSLYQGTIDKLVWRIGINCQLMWHDDVGKTKCCEYSREFEGETANFRQTAEEEYIFLFVIEPDGKEYLVFCMPLICPNDCNDCAPDCMKVSLSGYAHEKQFFFQTCPRGVELHESLIEHARVDVDILQCFITPDQYFGVFPFSATVVCYSINFDYLNGDYTLSRPSPYAIGQLRGGVGLTGACLWGTTWTTYVVFPPKMVITGPGTAVATSPDVIPITNAVLLASKFKPTQSPPNPTTERDSWMAEVSAIPNYGGQVANWGITSYYYSERDETPPLCYEIQEPYPDLILEGATKPENEVWIANGCQYLIIFEAYENWRWSQVLDWNPPGWRKGLLTHFKNYDPYYATAFRLGYPANERCLNPIDERDCQPLPCLGRLGPDEFPNAPDVDTPTYNGLTYLMPHPYAISCPSMRITGYLNGEEADCPTPPDGFPPTPEPPTPIPPRCVCSIIDIIHSLSVDSASSLVELGLDGDYCDEAFSLLNTEDVPECPFGGVYHKIRLEAWAKEHVECDPTDLVDSIYFVKGSASRIVTCSQRLFKEPAPSGNSQGGGDTGEPFHRVVLEGVYFACKTPVCPEEDDPITLDNEPLFWITTHGGCTKQVRFPCVESTQGEDCCPTEAEAIIHEVNLFGCGTSKIESCFDCPGVSGNGIVWIPEQCLNFSCTVELTGIPADVCPCLMGIGVRVQTTGPAHAVICPGSIDLVRFPGEEGKCKAAINGQVQFCTGFDYNTNTPGKVYLFIIPNPGGDLVLPIERPGQFDPDLGCGFSGQAFEIFS